MLMKKSHLNANFSEDITPKYEAGLTGESKQADLVGTLDSSVNWYDHLILPFVFVHPAHGNM